MRHGAPAAGGLALCLALIVDSHDALAEPPPAYQEGCAVRVDLDLTLAWLNWTPRYDPQTRERAVVPRLHRRTFTGPVLWTAKGPEARSLRCAASDPITGSPSLQNRDRCGAALVDAQVAEINRVLAEAMGLSPPPACSLTPPRTDFPACPTVETAGLEAWLLEQDPAPAAVRGETFPRTFACTLPSP